MKVIFLDIDGVLNSENWYRRRSKEVEMDAVQAQYPFYEFDPLAIKVLNRIVKETGAKVVVSSTWRLGKTVEELQVLLKNVGFEGEVIDKTASFRRGFEGIRYTLPRGCEIEYWLDQKGFQRINWSRETQQEYIDKSEVKNYIILDDDSDMLYGQREHFVNTKWPNGLSEELGDKSIKILNSTLIDLYYESHIS